MNGTQGDEQGDYSGFAQLKNGGDWVFVARSGKIPGFRPRLVEQTIVRRLTTTPGAEPEKKQVQQFTVVADGHPTIKGKLVALADLVAFCKGEKQLVFDSGPRPKRSRNRSKRALRELGPRPYEMRL